jgi:1-acyl-sn-glycerol-3-phosphate acyltransferase
MVNSCTHTLITPADAWLGAPLMDLWRWPLPYQHDSRANRILCRSVAAVIRPRIASVTGLEHIMPDRGAFLVAANHFCRRDALYLPAVLLVARGGLPVHFLADWNFKLIPGVAAIYRRSGAITVARKPAKPRLLNLLKPLLGGDLPPSRAAWNVLDAGRPVGLFPEGTTNRDPSRLMRGRSGCARLSLETGAPVIPVGIRYPGFDDDPGKPLGAAVCISIGEPLSPPPIPPEARAPLVAVRAWHARIMTAIALQCEKPWLDAEPALQPNRGDD